MQPSSFENMQRCFELISRNTDLSTLQRRMHVLELVDPGLGGGYRTIFEGPTVDYICAGSVADEGIDVVLVDPDHLPFDDGSVDIVVSGQRSVRAESFGRTFAEMARVISADGYIVLIAPSAGPIQHAQVDDPQIVLDAYATLGAAAGLHLIHRRLDERGPWHHGVGIFSNAPRTLDLRRSRGAVPFTRFVPTGHEPVLETTAGHESYLDVLRRVHDELRPDRYLEIGVRHGRSLALARCEAVAVDPAPELLEPIGSAQLFTETSDEFFELDAAEALRQPPDLVFIDGMHLFEYALRDFMNVERHATTTTVVAVDDVLPNHPAQAERIRRTNVWCGDVWKLGECLARYRTDLRLVFVDSYPTGLLFVMGLDPASRTLWERYDEIVTGYAGGASAIPPSAVLSRAEAIAPTDRTFTSTLRLLRDARQRSRSDRARSG